MQNINFDDIISQTYYLCPNLQRSDVKADAELRRKVHLQLFNSNPEVQLQKLDLKCIIMNVKKSLSEFQRRIDESVAQQHLRRTTRVRKTIFQDPAVVKFFNPGARVDRKGSISGDGRATSCNNNGCCDHLTELNGLVQVESLPLTASTNLITIFIPTILQETWRSCKYKISIDLNRLDISKKIVDINLEHHLKTTNASELEKMKKNTHDSNPAKNFKINVETHTSVETQTVNDFEKENKIEIKTSPQLGESPAPLVQNSTSQSNISIELGPEAELTPTQNKRTLKRRVSKAVSDDPPKKRGRKPGSKNKKTIEKSELAKYVEMFECNAQSPSTVSQHVTSTTQNWDGPPVQSGQVAYLLNGTWTLSAPTNSDPQSVSTTDPSGTFAEGTNSGQEGFIPFEDFVNFIENQSIDDGNNVIARVLDGNGEVTQNNNLNSIASNPNTIITQTNGSYKIVGPTQEEASVSQSAKENLESSTKEINVAHSTTANYNDGLLCYPHNSPTATQKKNTNVSEENAKDSSIIFKTARNMPLLDDINDHLFGASSQQAKIVFSTSIPAQLSSKTLSGMSKDSVSQSPIEKCKKDKEAVSIEDDDISRKDKTKVEAMTAMSLLEIEKNIEDSQLDFDNCVNDDLLSLAPSSGFNSPAEDRFADFTLLDDSTSNVRYQNCANVSKNNIDTAPSSYLDTLFSQTNQQEVNVFLKQFKIPRRKSVNNEPRNELLLKTLAPSMQNPLGNANQNLITSFSDNYLSPTPSLTIVNASLPKDSTSDVNLSSPIQNQDISKMFGSICYGFLANRCFESSCKYSHQLLEHRVVVPSLSLLQNRDLNAAYRIIWRHYKMFKLYFPIFCEEYARRKMRSKLFHMIYDCEIQPDCLLFIKNVFTALTCTGLNKINACRFMLSRVKERSHETVDLLLGIILKADAALFAPSIEEFSQITDYKFRMQDINLMATACLCSGSAELITALMRCLISVDQNEFLTMRSPDLVQLLEMVKDGTLASL